MESKYPIRLRELSESGEVRYVDKPCYGELQPDNFSVYIEGYSNNPIPTYHQDFIIQFKALAKELDLKGIFC